MWDTISDCLEENGSTQELTVSAATCFSEDKGKLCATLQRLACETCSGNRAKCVAEELWW